jgi:hypothetical protein
MTAVEVFVDPSCPWAWITTRWLKEIAPVRDLGITWRSYCIEIRDDYGVVPTMPEDRRAAALAGHALSHRMLRIMEAARASAGDTAVDALLTEWADDESWDVPIVASMEVAYAFGGPKTQTPTIVVYDDPPHGFKGPVMAPAPTGEAAVAMWDAIQVLSKEPGFFEITRPRANRPLPPARD